MKVVHVTEGEFEPVRSALFVGEVSRRSMISASDSKQVTVGHVKFEAGGRNVFHTHSFDQVLYVTEGEGIIALDGQEVVIRAGDIVVIPAGEKHWHGATNASGMSHLAIGAPGETQIVE